MGVRPEESNGTHTGGIVIEETSLPLKANSGDDHSHEVQGGSLSAAVFGIVKAMVGPAILYLPHAFADAGYAFSIVALIFALLMYLYSSTRLLESWRVETERKGGKRKVIVSTESGVEMVGLLNLGKTDSEKAEKDKDSDGASASLSRLESELDDDADDSVEPTKSVPETTSISYPQLAKLAYGLPGETIVRAGVALMQLGVCLTYFIFVPHNLSSSIKTLWHVDVPMWVCLVGMVLVEIPLSSIRNIRRLTYTNVIANCLILFGLLSCLWLALWGQMEDEATESFSSKMSDLKPLKGRWYLFVGTSVLLFEGSITLCIPLQEAVQGKTAQLQFPSVYRGTISSIVAFYSFFGIVCWSAFGDEVQTVLTTSLPDGVLTTSVQLAYSLAVIFTFPLQVFPALDIVFEAVKRRVGADHSINISCTQRLVIVTVVITQLAVIAIVEMDNLGHVVSLMGALLGCPLAFVFPPLIHNKIVADKNMKVTNRLVAGFGVFAMVGATFSTLATWNDEGGERRYAMR